VTLLREGRPTLEALSKKYGNDLRIVFKHNPLGFIPNAMPAALAAECAREQGKFWQISELMSPTSSSCRPITTRSGRSRSAWTWVASRSALQIRSTSPDRRGPAHQYAARRARDPGLLHQRRFLSGAQPQPAFEALIDEELKKAKASGMAAKEYYQKAVVEKGEKSM